MPLWGRKRKPSNSTSYFSDAIFDMLGDPKYALLPCSFFSFISVQRKTVQHKLAELKTHICVTRAFVDSCLQLHQAKRLDSATASMAKYWYVCYSN